MLQFEYKEAAKKFYREPAGENAVGFLPNIFHAGDPRNAREQIEDRYNHGGGWFELKGVTMAGDRSLRGVGPGKFPVLAEAKLRDETILVYPSAYVAVVQPDGSFAVTRMD